MKKSFHLKKQICETVLPIIILFLIIKIGFIPVWILMFIGIVIYSIYTKKKHLNSPKKTTPNTQSSQPYFMMGLLLITTGIFFEFFMYQSIGLSINLIFPLLFIIIGCLFTFTGSKIIFLNIQQGKFASKLYQKIKQVSGKRWTFVIGMAWLPALFCLYLIQPGQLYCNRSENMCYLQQIQWGLTHTYQTIPINEIQQAIIKTEEFYKPDEQGKNQKHYQDKIILKTSQEDIPAPYISTDIRANGEPIHSVINQKRTDLINQFLGNSDTELYISDGKIYLFIPLIFFIFGLIFLF